jgi:hypothetical protein
MGQGNSEDIVTVKRIKEKGLGMHRKKNEPRRAGKGTSFNSDEPNIFWMEIPSESEKLMSKAIGSTSYVNS